ncbi:MAG: hypothetical protein HYS04_12690, partial [Acidobacteria bacterium]|nr:hypothetical protein [Acidobacteriota bacterium]
MRRATVVLLLLSAPALAEVFFVRDVMPVLNKTGCTAGPCHGGAKGKNGFKLSLRGYDPEFDYRAILHDLQGRRINRIEPEKSLVLLKPTMQIPHGGGVRFEQDSAYYRLILDWLKAGAPFGDPVSAQVARLEVQPAEFFAEKPGLAQQLKVIAHYANGDTRDVTREAQYSSSIPTVAEVSDGGHIKTLRQGEAAT